MIQSLIQIVLLPVSDFKLDFLCSLPSFSKGYSTFTNSASSHRLPLRNPEAPSLYGITFFQVTTDHLTQSPSPGCRFRALPLLLCTIDPASLLASPLAASVFSYFFLSPKCQSFSRFCPWLFSRQWPSLGRRLSNIYLCLHLPSWRCSSTFPNACSISMCACRRERPQVFTYLTALQLHPWFKSPPVLINYTAKGATIHTPSSFTGVS